MAYTKKVLDDRYNSMLNVLKSYSYNSNRISGFSGITSNISNLEWQSNTRDAVVSSVSVIDKACTSLSDYYNELDKKVDVCFNSLSVDIDALKSEIEHYNSLVDQYNAISEDHNEE